jgi:hypothetical protein
MFVCKLIEQQIVCFYDLLISGQVGSGKVSVCESLGSRHCMLLYVEARQSYQLCSSSLSQISPTRTRDLPSSCVSIPQT